MADKKLAVIGGTFIAMLLVCCYFNVLIAATVFAFVSVLCAILFFVIGRREWRSVLLIFIGSALAAILFFGIFTQAKLKPLEKLYGEKHNIVGTVYSVEDSVENRKIVLSASTVDGKSVDLPFKLTVYTDKGFEADVDDVIYTYGKVYGLEDWWMRYNYSKGIYFSLYPDDIEVIGERSPHSINYYASKARTWMRESYSSVFTGDALSFVEGITLGEKSGMSDAQLTVNQQAGISHAFAVSGMHMAFMTMMISFALRLLHVNSKISAVITIIAVVAFMFLQSFTASVTRAGIMIIVMLFGRLINRERTPSSAVAFAAIVIALANPYAVCDVSFQLSFSAVIGILICAKPFTEAFKTIFDGIKIPSFISTPIAASLAVTCAAVLFTAPISIAVFEYVSPITFFTNLLGIGAIEIMFIASYLFIPLSFIPGVREALAGFIEVTVRYINFIVNLMGKASIAELYPEPAVLWVTLALIVLILAISIFSGKGKKKKGKKLSKRKMRKLVTTLIAIIVVIAGSLTYTEVTTKSTFSGEQLVFSAVSVGQGDCIVVSKGEKAIVLDCGSKQGIAAESLRKYISQTNIKEIEAIVVSHMHDDHVNGVAEIAEYYNVDALYLPREYEYTEFGKEIDKVIPSSSIIEVVDDLTLAHLLDGVTFNLYTDFADDYDFTNDDHLNKGSTIVMVDYGDSEFLVTGDTTTAAEGRLVKQGYDIDVDVLKVAHHGSKSSSKEEFLQAITADIAVISYGDNNYGHPSPEIVERLEIYIPTIYDTFNGTVTLVTVGNGEYELVN